MAKTSDRLIPGLKLALALFVAAPAVVPGTALAKGGETRAPNEGAQLRHPGEGRQFRYDGTHRR